MRILCLHGTAINATIFQSKTEKLRSFLPADYSFEWFEGNFTIVPQKELADVFPGPYLTYIDLLSTDRISRALSRIEEFIEDEGPFDGVMGVSEGSMLSSALILKHQIEDPFANPLFKFAIFISGTLPFSWSDSYGQDVFGLIIGDNPLSTDAADWQYQSKYAQLCAEPLKDSPARVLADMFPTWRKRRELLVSLVQDPGNGYMRPRCFHPDLTDERINIPTAHVWGSTDLFKPHAQQLVRLCDESLALTFEHSGDHDTPTKLEENRLLAQIVQKTIMRSKFSI